MITQCNCCRINTVGQHESDCPNNPISTTISNAKGNDYRVAYLQVECPNCTRLEKENAELKAKCNLCYDDKAEKSNNALIELNNKLVVRNGRILDLENELTEYELINKHHIELIGRLEEQLKAIKYLDEDVETLSAQFHDVYMIEANKQGNTRNKQNYNDLAENVKEYDRVLARYVLSLAIPKVKYLYRQEVKTILYSELSSWEEIEGWEEAIDAICKLAIPSRDKIIEVLNIRLDPVGCPDKTKFIELIADEILGEE